MSGVEVIGIIASASQLVRYLLEIIDYTQTVSVLIKSASCLFQQHRQHLENLVSTVEDIRRIPCLQTSLIETHLETLLSRTASLRHTLKPFSRVSQQTALGKICTAIQARKAEGQILKDLNILERDKSNLILCITSSYGNILHGIQERTNPDLVVTKNNMSDKPTKEAIDKDREGGRLRTVHVPANYGAHRQNSGSSTFKSFGTFLYLKPALTFLKVILRS